VSQLLQDLRAARALIEDPKRWTKGEEARNADGDPIHPSKPEAVCWCALGATIRVGGNRADLRTLTMACALRDAEPSGFGVVDVNDRDGHAAVLALYDRAIAKEEAK
jgi:hypothetical protein